MINPENFNNKPSRVAQIAANIEELRKTKLINQSDPKYVAEIEERIIELIEELDSLT